MRRQWFRSRIYRKFKGVPNVLTYSRVVISPVVLYLYLSPVLAKVFPATQITWYRGAAALLVLVAIATEFLDGKLARRYRRFGWETPYGRNLDPFADKMLGFCALGAFLAHAGIDWYLMWFTPPAIFLIVYSSITTQMRKKNAIVAPNDDAKLKTFFLMTAKGVAFVGFWVTHLLEMPTLDEYVIYFVSMLVGVAAVFAIPALRKYEDGAKLLGQPAQ